MLPALLIFLPFLFGITDCVIAGRSERGRDLFVVIVSWISLGLSILLMILFLKDGDFSCF